MKANTYFTREDIKEAFLLEDKAIFLDPPEYFDIGIVGVSEDSQHVIYSYDKLVDHLAMLFKQVDVIAQNETKLADEYETDAKDYLDKNTVPLLNYMDAEYKPVIIMELQ